MEFVILFMLLVILYYIIREAVSEGVYKALIKYDEDKNKKEE